MSPKIESETFSVSWTGLDVLIFLGVWFIAQIVCAAVIYQTLPQEPTVTVTLNEQEHHGHLVVQLIEQSVHSPMVLLVAFLAAVVAAPLVEELLFRLFLQGWVEAKFSQFRVPCASGVAIIITSCFFAIIHAGSSSASHRQPLFYLFSAVTVTNLLIFASGIIYLVRKRNVKLTHCLFGTESFFRPQFLANAGWCLLALVFIFGVSFILNVCCPSINTDPIPIFIFSLLLGTLYYRTRNLSYCILLHACLNLISLILLCLGGG